MSIYVSIATLEDPELEHTIASAINNADNYKNICIGVAFNTSKNYFDFMSKKIFHPNVITKHFNIKDNRGVGFGRNNAKSLYDGQNYFLQVDAHTFFQPKWDQIVMELYDLAIQDTNNKKTVLTAIPPRYSIKNKIRKIDDGAAGYPVFLQERYFWKTGITRWTDEKMKKFPVEDRTDKKIIPCIKFNAAFALGNQEFAISDTLSNDTLFFEEEIFQTINLLEQGFSLAFPNCDIPVNHLFWDGQDLENGIYRQEVISTFPDFNEDIFSNKINDHYHAFLNNPKNKEKCKLFKEYTNYDLYTGECISFYIPKQHNR